MCYFRYCDLNILVSTISDCNMLSVLYYFQFSDKNLSASIAALQPEPAAVIACL